MGRPSKRPAIQAEILRRTTEKLSLNPRAILTVTGGSLSTILDELKKATATGHAPGEPNVAASPVEARHPSNAQVKAPSSDKPPSIPHPPGDRLDRIEASLLSIEGILGATLQDVAHAVSRSDETYRAMMIEIDRARQSSGHASATHEASPDILTQARLDAQVRENTKLERRVRALEGQLKAAGLEPD